MTMSSFGWVEALLLSVLAIGHALILWASREMPHERWQFVASIPLRKVQGDLWHGLNLTWYGALTALAFVIAVACVVVLSASVAIGIPVVVVTCALLCALSLWASRAVAQWVERIPNTHTVGGALFVVVLAAPVVLLAASAVGQALGLGPQLTNHQALQMLSAMVIGYTFGEGIGRVACISFGCCWGVRVDQLKGPWRKLFSKLNFKFYGATKKIAYASDLAGVPVVPIQAMTASWHLVVGVTATWLFLRGYPAAAMIFAMAATQLWRFASEFLRADFRGFGRITKYQWMALATIAICVIYAMMLKPVRGVASMPDLMAGLGALWSPWVLLALQALFLAVFLKVAPSSVTKARMRLSMAHDES
jgi:prolipoprotein diacylglyceryltransferase